MVRLESSGQGARVACSYSAERISTSAEAATVTDMVAGSSTARRARVILGICMPRSCRTSDILHYVATLHEHICAFADVIVVCAEDFGEDLEGMEMFEHQLLEASRKVRAAASDERVELTQLFSAEDGKVHADRHTWHDIASSIARWGDIFLMAPFCWKYMSRFNHHLDEDLLSGLVARWGYCKRADGEYSPTRPLIVAPLIDPILRCAIAC